MDQTNLLVSAVIGLICLVVLLLRRRKPKPRVVVSGKCYLIGLQFIASEINRTVITEQIVLLKIIKNIFQ